MSEYNAISEDGAANAITINKQYTVSLVTDAVGTDAVGTVGANAESTLGENDAHLTADGNALNGMIG